MKLRSVPVLLGMSTVIAAAAIVSAQSPAQAPPEIGHSLNGMADQPATHVGFVIDRSMLQAARGILESEGGMTPERAAAALSSISYDMYRYPEAATYNAQAMGTVTDAYRAAGWRHLVNAHEPPPGTTPHGIATDLWLHFTGSDVDGITVMMRGAKDMNVIQVACDLKPLELLRLSGHFGIPKVDPSAVMVPAPNGR